MNLCGVLTGAIAVVWGYLALKPNAGLFLHVLYQVDSRHLWPVMMVAQGTALLFGSMCNCAPLRRWAFICGAMMWGALFATATFLYIDGRLARDTYFGPVGLLVPLLCVMCVTALSTEAHRRSKGK